ncbi:uncharacterized protein LOC115228512 [Octopus sinensis]|uniref:Uncharacterized protein LOC115228512 n=1 Tax=Octopus sinensis TaxID=2607531 RepID=A0A6P7TYE4_9MOLL|nr:uncharacterized protein LOC115228512 [Octopus sinensis]
MIAASFGNTDSVQILLKHGSRIASIDKNDRNSIFLAAQENQSVTLTKELLGHPLAMELIHSKWVNYGQYFFYINMLFSLIFTVALTTYLYLSNSPKFVFIDKLIQSSKFKYSRMSFHELQQRNWNSNCNCMISLLELAMATGSGFGFSWMHEYDFNYAEICLIRDLCGHVGLAVDDIKGVQEEAVLQKIAKQA